MLSRVPLRIVAAFLAAAVCTPALAQEAAATAPSADVSGTSTDTDEAAATPPSDTAVAVTVPQVAGPGLPTLGKDDGSNLAQRIITGSQAARCRPGRRADGSIIVCGSKEANEAERLPLRDQTESALSTKDGLPRAPNVSGLAPCKHNGACLGFGSVPAPMYYFDITALPAPPPGSDADRIAKGEIRAP